MTNRMAGQWLSPARGPLLALLWLALALPCFAQQAPSGPVTRRPPGAPGADTPVPLPAPRQILVPPTEPTPAPPEAAGSEPELPNGDAPALQVLDASVFEDVFAPYTIRNGRQIPNPLAGEEGDPVAGRWLYHDFTRTGCSLCHGTAEAPRKPDEDRAGPDLHGVGTRLSPGRIRLWIVAPGTIRPTTVMPAFHKPGQRDDPTDPLYGGPRLTAAEVEDIVAYLTRDAPEGGITEPLDANVMPGEPPGVGQTAPGR